MGMLTEKGQKKRGKNRRKVVVEQIRDVFYIKEAIYSNCSYWAGETIDICSTKKLLRETLIALRCKVVV